MAKTKPCIPVCAEFNAALCPPPCGHSVAAYRNVLKYMRNLRGTVPAAVICYTGQSFPERISRGMFWLTCFHPAQGLRHYAARRAQAKKEPDVSMKRKYTGDLPKHHGT
ncbi:MAG TPA: hypothetical protein PLX33_12805 [Alphaproteobacteria bacterium]|nr:hypothetical protein [Alphaproteobacteria bacterium]